MATATFHTLTKPEQALMSETSRARLKDLGEDELADLLVRVRRARDKAWSQHRREVSSHIETVAARGKATAAPRHKASRVELWEDALARVSAALAKAARQSAAELKAERLAAARGAKATAPARRATPTPEPADTSAPRSRTRSPAQRTTDSSTLAAGQRRQAKRDAR